jgi:hypothetical protein
VACLIGKEVAIDFIDGHEDKVSAGIVGFLRDILHRVIEAVGNLKWHGCWSGLSGLDSLALLVVRILWRLRCDGMFVEMLVPANP